MRTYEIMIAVRGSLIASEAKTAYDAFITSLSAKGGKVTYEDDWNKIPLAYKIKKESEAYFSVIHFEMESTKVKSLELELELNAEIIRHLITKVEDTKATPYNKTNYDEDMEAFNDEKLERKKKAMPKTRATTARQLEEDMDKIKKRKTAETSAKANISKELGL
ncbi:30S ribosomal protein S6 [Candidatus Peregrinibacteria bacterium]|nr:MAG: 30S ribosomal protein S6 [Candidatus Peregrinibacteria bacterium]